jgi:hypothetical protein
MVWLVATARRSGLADSKERILMFHNLRFRLLPLVVLGLALGLAPATAGAKPSATQAVHVQKGDHAQFTLSNKTKRKLNKRHVRLTTNKPGTRSKSKYSLPAKSGRWNFTTARGTVQLKGALRLRAGRRAVNLGLATFSRPAKGVTQVTVKVRGRRVRLFRISGRAHVKRKGNSETVSGLTAHLAQAGVKRINKILHRRSVTTGELVGAFTVTVSRKAASASKPTPKKPGPTNAAGVGITLSKGSGSVGGLLSSVSAISPATGGLLGTADGTSVTLPLASGGSATAGFNDGTLTGTLPLSGGLTLDKGAASVSLTNPQLTLGTGTEGSALSFSVNGGPEVKLFSVDTAQLEKSATSNGSLDLKGLLATLSTEGAASLNTVLNTHAFTTGQTLGGLTVIVPAKSGS